MSICIHTSSPLYDSFFFVPPTSGCSRSPCPALNTLANHGYIPRSGTHIPFWTLLTAIRRVYNISLPLAVVLTTIGYITCGTFSLSSPTQTTRNASHLSSLTRFLPRPSWTLDLESLCTPGPFKIAHDASLVHKDIPGSAADPALMAQLLQLAHHQPLTPYHTSLIAPIHTTCEKEQDGVTLGDLGRLHAAREAALPSTHKLSWLHEQVALGECGLAWCVLHAHGRGAEQGVIPLRSIEQWFGKERLPDGWWDVGGGRPVREVGLKDARKRAAEAGLFRDGRQPYSLYTY